MKDVRIPFIDIGGELGHDHLLEYVGHDPLGQQRTPLVDEVGALERACLDAGRLGETTTQRRHPRLPHDAVEGAHGSDRAAEWPRVDLVEQFTQIRVRLVHVGDVGRVVVVVVVVAVVAERSPRAHALLKQGRDERYDELGQVEYEKLVGVVELQLPELNNQLGNGHIVLFGRLL